jgi:multiple sugar transport system substrate-binding protein
MSTQLSRRDLLRYTAVGASGMAVAGLLAACAPGGSTAGTSPATRSAKPANFDFVNWNTSEAATAPATQAAINAFGHKERVQITTTDYPYNSFLNELTLQVRGGQFAGASQLDVAWLATLAAQGKLKDLSSYAKGMGYTPSALKSGQVNGRQLGLPWTTGAIGIITNSEILQKAKVSSSWATIDEFTDALKAIKGLGNGMIPYAASTAAAQLQDFLVWMQTFGCPIVENGKCVIGDDGSVRAATWYKQLYDQKLIAANVDRTAARNLFAQQRTAMYDDAPVGVASVVTASPDKNIASQMVPVARPVQKKGDTPQELLWGHLVVVIEGGSGDDTAAEFAQWITSNPTQTEGYFGALGLPPTTTKALASPYVAGNKFVSEFTSKVTTNATASPLWPFPQNAQMINVLAAQVQAVLIGSSSPAAAMKAAGQGIQNLIQS